MLDGSSAHTQKVGTRQKHTQKERTHLCQCCLAERGRLATTVAVQHSKEALGGVAVERNQRDVGVLLTFFFLLMHRTFCCCPSEETKKPLLPPNTNPSPRCLLGGDQYLHCPPEARVFVRDNADLEHGL